ncbi:MAG: DUF4258 domain-containing protein [Proteobacteria bacterium]|nr:MAG: DUF4258 domain-containing protein [Pseudomonadota bacterium]
MTPTLQRIRDAFKQGRIIISRHARERSMERNVTTGDMHNAIENGHITEVRLNPEFGVDDYAIEGPGLDHEKVVRVVVSFVETSRGESVIVITLIHLR